jgi:hypothetical protein
LLHQSQSAGGLRHRCGESVRRLPAAQFGRDSRHTPLRMNIGKRRLIEMHRRDPDTSTQCGLCVMNRAGFSVGPN